MTFPTPQYKPAPSNAAMTLGYVLQGTKEGEVRVETRESRQAGRVYSYHIHVDNKDYLIDDDLAIKCLESIGISHAKAERFLQKKRDKFKAFDPSEDLIGPEQKIDAIRRKILPSQAEYTEEQALRVAFRYLEWGEVSDSNKTAYKSILSGIAPNDWMETVQLCERLLLNCKDKKPKIKVLLLEAMMRIPLSQRRQVVNQTMTDKTWATVQKLNAEKIVEALYEHRFPKKLRSKFFKLAFGNVFEFFIFFLEVTEDKRSVLLDFIINNQNGLLLDRDNDLKITNLEILIDHDQKDWSHLSRLLEHFTLVDFTTYYECYNCIKDCSIDERIPLLELCLKIQEDTNQYNRIQLFHALKDIIKKDRQEIVGKIVDLKTKVDIWSYRIRIIKILGQIGELKEKFFDLLEGLSARANNEPDLINCLVEFLPPSHIVFLLKEFSKEKQVEVMVGLKKLINIVTGDDYIMELLKAFKGIPKEKIPEFIDFIKLIDQKNFQDFKDTPVEEIPKLIRLLKLLLGDRQGNGKDIIINPIIQIPIQERLNILELTINFSTLHQFFSKLPIDNIKVMIILKGYPSKKRENLLFRANSLMSLDNWEGHEAELLFEIAALGEDLEEVVSSMISWFVRKEPEPDFIIEQELAILKELNKIPVGRKEALSLLIKLVKHKDCKDCHEYKYDGYSSILREIVDIQPENSEEAVNFVISLRQNAPEDDEGVCDLLQAIKGKRK